MGLNIVTSMQPLNVENIITFIYGDPGTWKTTLGFTAKNPILFDFDKGAYAAGAFRKDSVQISSWSEVARFTAQDLQGYDTIVIDTVGRALDMLTEQLVTDSKNVRRGSADLSMQGYGKLKTQFVNWLKMLRSMGKDIVLLAHAKAGTNNDGDVTHAPDVQGSSLSEVYKVSDLVGFLTIENERKSEVRKLNFVPSSHYYGKDRGRIGNITLRPMQDAPNQLANIIQATKDHINSLSAEAAKAQKELDDLRNDLLDAKTADDFNKLNASIDMSHPLAKQMKKDLFSYAKTVKGVTADEVAKCFVDVLEPEPEPVVAEEFEPTNEQEAEVANVE